MTVPELLFCGAILVITILAVIDTWKELKKGGR